MDNYEDLFQFVEIMYEMKFWLGIRAFTLRCTTEMLRPPAACATPNMRHAKQHQHTINCLHALHRFIYVFDEQTDRKP